MGEMRIGVLQGMDKADKEARGESFSLCSGAVRPLLCVNCSPLIREACFRIRGFCEFHVSRPRRIISSSGREKTNRKFLNI